MGQKSILVIEDDSSVQRMLKLTLERAGYAVTTADNGRVGVRNYHSSLYDVVITDLIMPDMEGIETIISLRKNHPGVKIIAMSGGGINDSADYLKLARQLGAHRTFAKPIPRQDLLEAVAELIS